MDFFGNHIGEDLDLAGSKILSEQEQESYGLLVMVLHQQKEKRL